MRFRLIPVFLLTFASGACGGKSPDADKVAVEVALDAPDTAWSVTIEEIRRVGDEAWVLARLKRSEGAGGMAITPVSDEVLLEPPVPPRRFFVVGKTWKWTGDEGYEYLTKVENLPKEWADGETLYQKPGKEAEKENSPDSPAQ